DHPHDRAAARDPIELFGIAAALGTATSNEQSASASGQELPRRCRSERNGVPGRLPGLHERGRCNGALTGYTYTGAVTCSVGCVGVPPSPLDATVGFCVVDPSRK